MNKLALAGIVGLALLGGGLVAPLAFAADDPTPCSTALLVQADLTAQVAAATEADNAAADAQKLYDTLAAADKELAAAIKADNDTGATQDSQRTKDAKAAQAAAKKAVEAFEAKGTIEALRAAAAKTDADALRVKLAAAVVAATEACRGADAVAYEDCDAVRAAGRAPLALNQPGYRAGLDADGDGLACELIEDSPQVVVIPKAIDTGLA